MKQGLSQADLATKLNTTQTTISNWEFGSCKPNKANLKRLIEVLGDFQSSADDTDGVAHSSVGAFGAWLRRAREGTGMSVPELATTAMVSAQTIYLLESGISQNPQSITKKKLEEALRAKIPSEVVHESESSQSIQGLGPLIDFDPYEKLDRPTCSGVYVLYDISDRPIYVGKGINIADRIDKHKDMFWFKFPLVTHGAYLKVNDSTLRHQVEQALIKFLKSHAVINRQSVDR
jgi:transcriptional regulator with XRE-family HTH domain